MNQSKSDSKEPILINLLPINENAEIDDTSFIDLCVIYFCSVLSVIFPLIGFLYIGCTHKNTNWRTNLKILKAYLILIICTVSGVIWQTIVFILIKTNTIHI